MNILISRNAEVFPASLSGGESLALYTVPQDYSPDGLYMARWGAKELEPVPACDDAVLLLKLALEQDNGGMSVREIYREEGVEYAQN